MAGLSFAHRLTAAVDAGHRTWRELAAALDARGHHVPAATLRSWGTGLSLPDTLCGRVALPALERELGLEPGGLASGLPPVPGGDRPVQRPVGAPPGSGDVPSRLAAELGLPEANPVRVIALHRRLTIGADRALALSSSRQTLVASRLAHGQLVWLSSEPGDPTPYLLPLRGCRIAHTVEVERTIGFDLRFSEVLHAGEITEVEYAVGYVEGGGPADTYWEAQTSTALRELHVEAIFDPTARPTAVEFYLLADGAERTVPVTLSQDGLAQLHMEDFGPGAYGCRWRW